MAKSRYAKMRSRRRNKKCMTRRRRQRGGGTALTPAQQACMNTYLQNPERDNIKKGWRVKHALNDCLRDAGDDPMGKCMKDMRAGTDYAMTCRKVYE